MEALIDSDFFRSLSDPRNPGLFVDLMKFLDISPAVHCYVKDHELIDSDVFRGLTDSGFIKVYDYSDFLPDERGRNRYSMNVANLYKVMNGEEPNERSGVFTNHTSDKNMGEIHTALLAQILNISYFMSNDKAAKAMIERRINSSKFTLNVKNIYDVFMAVAERPEKPVAWKTVKAILKEKHYNEEKIEKLNSLWHKEPDTKDPAAGRDLLL